MAPRSNIPSIDKQAGRVALLGSERGDHSRCSDTGCPASPGRQKTSASLARQLQVILTGTSLAIKHCWLVERPTSSLQSHKTNQIIGFVCGSILGGHVQEQQNGPSDSEGSKHHRLATHTFFNRSMPFRNSITRFHLAVTWSTNFLALRT